MKIMPLSLPGAAVVLPDPFIDHRGVFARFFCQKELAGIIGGRKIVNVNFSRSVQKGAIRGLHFQRPPKAEMKLVRCIRGAVFDVFVDLRKGSPTFLKWFGTELSAENMKMLCVPEGFAHGFQVLEDNSEILYLVTEFYSPNYEGSIHHSDPRIGIEWPLSVTDISEKDQAAPMIDPGFEGLML